MKHEDNECWIIVKRIDTRGLAYEKVEARIRREDLEIAMLVADKFSRRATKEFQESVEIINPRRYKYLTELENNMII